MHWLYSTELVFGVAAQDKPSNAAFKSPGRHFHAINDCAKGDCDRDGKHADLSCTSHTVTRSRPLFRSPKPTRATEGASSSFSPELPTWTSTKRSFGTAR